MAFWPGFLALLVPVHRPGRRRLAIATGVLLGLACGLSRAMSHVHPWSEVISGLVLGSTVALIGLRSMRGTSMAHSLVSTIPGLLLTGAFIGLVGPVNLPTERWLAQAGALIAGREQPIKRREWLSESAAMPIRSPQPSE